MSVLEKDRTVGWDAIPAYGPNESGGFSLMQTFAEWFAWQPYRCGFLAAIFSVFILLPFHKTGAKACFTLAALIWWLLTYTEATTSPTSNIRIDLVFTLPAAAILGVLALVLMVFGRKRNV